MTTPDQLLAAYKANIESLIDFSHKSFSNIEKLVELNLNTLKTGLNDNSEAIRTLLSVKDAQELMNATASIAQPAAKNLAAYNQNLYELASTSVSEVSRLIEAQVADGNRKVASMVDAASRNAPAGSESAVALVKSALSAASTAYDTVSKAAKQVADITEANVSAATSATLRAATNAIPPARSSAKQRAA
ncbi:MAG: TIGR01841 family phasin [Burkholderiaceae bacterium]